MNMVRVTSLSRVTSLPAFRFLKRLAASKESAQALTTLATDADTKLKDVNEQLRRNVESQRILNKHLAERNKARSAKILPFNK